MLLALFRLFSFLPLLLLHGMGVVLGWLTYLLSSSYRTRLNDHIGLAGYSAQLGAAVVEAGKSLMELPFIWCARPERVLATVRLAHWEVAQAALDAGKGVIFLTPHLGCFEIIAQAIAVRAPLLALYRPPRKAWLRPLLEHARARGDLTLAPANLGGVRQLLKALRAGKAIGLLPDQVPQQGEGVWADFFGKPAYTMTLPGKLQSMSGAPIILSYAKRLAWGQGYEVCFVPFDEELGDSPEQQTGAINRAMEKLIANCPEQYFWSYHRYKTPPGATPVAAEGDRS